MFDKFDKFLFSQIKKNIDHFEDIIGKIIDTPYKIHLTQENLDGEIKIKVTKGNKTTDHKITVFGWYDLKKEVFTWKPAFKKMFDLPDVKKELLAFYGKSTTIKKLLQDTVKIENNDHGVIPYLFSIHCAINPDLNLMRFRANGTELIYAVIDLKIKPIFDIQKYYDSLKDFRSLMNAPEASISKKLSRTKTENKRKLRRAEIKL